jgi:hypothetical protein
VAYTWADSKTLENRVSLLLVVAGKRIFFDWDTVVIRVSYLKVMLGLVFKTGFEN